MGDPLRVGDPEPRALEELSTILKHIPVPSQPLHITVTDTQTHTAAPYPTIALDKPEREGTRALGSVLTSSDPNGEGLGPEYSSRPA